MKKIFITVLTFLLIILIIPPVQATVTLVPIEKTSGSGYVTYRNSSVQVLIPTEYTIQETDFRAVWVSPLVSDIGSYITDASFKAELLSVLDTMEYFKLNAIVFHIRIMHDALYDSDLNMKSTYVSGANFERWDYLEWFIGECHRRGIEFHAWMNPYRITRATTSLDFITSKYENEPQNPASKAENVIITSPGAILNPGEPAVRDFLVDTCMEVIAKYDVDAIHFDDYFYASMSSTADLTTYNKYKASSSTTNIYDWRREQIDLFIQDLSQTIRQYNSTHQRYVQLGIAPTGIWRNGNGVVTYDEFGTAVTNGSNTAGQEHYSSYLYCNTKKWVDNEWIDYIIPQSYWSFELYAAPYADVIDWWAKVVKYKNVNLYAGMGLYRMYSGDAGGSWETNPMEAANQILYNTKHPEVQGVCIFNYRYLNQSKNVAGVSKITSEFWTNKALTPELRTVQPVQPARITDLQLVPITDDKIVLTWTPVANVNKYAIYRNQGTVNPDDPTQLVDMIGPNENNDLIYNNLASLTDDYQYAVVPVSKTNTPGTASVIDMENASTTLSVQIGNFHYMEAIGTIYPGNTFSFYFEKAQVFVGSAFSYQVYYSYDGSNWTESDANIREIGQLHTFTMNFPANGTASIAIKIIAENEAGTIESVPYRVQPTITGLPDWFAFIKTVLDQYYQNIFRNE